MAQSSISKRYELLLIGGSAGSLEVLLQLLPALNKDLLFAIVIVLHRKNGESLLMNVLNDRTTWLVKEAEEKEKIAAQTIYLAPADYHLLIEKDKTFSLDYSEKVHYSRPSIDVTFETAAESFGPSLIGLLLSGANADGTDGLQNIKRSGGLTIVQDPKDAVVAFMPEAAIKGAKVDYVLSTQGIGKLLNSLVG